MSDDLNNRMKVHCSGHCLKNRLKDCNSGGGMTDDLNNRLLVGYSGHGLKPFNNQTIINQSVIGIPTVLLNKKTVLF